MSDNQLNSTTAIFPNLEKDGVVLEPFFGDLEFHFLRLLLDDLATLVPPSVEDTSALDSESNLSVITPELAKTAKIMRGIMGNTLRLNRTRMLESLQERQLSKEQQAVSSLEIENINELWFTSIMLTMLTKLGVGLTLLEREQLIVNVRLFLQSYNK